MNTAPGAPTAPANTDTSSSTTASVHAAVAGIAARFAADRHDRQRRRHLDPDDFRDLASAGVTLTGVPAAQGGLWDTPQSSVRATARVLHALAQGDSSVALVCAMHPSVLSYWLTSPHVNPEHQAAWDAQRRWVWETVRGGAWWGTITSEPGSGGDVMRTRATAQRSAPAPGQEHVPGTHYRVTGEKHFGSGSGIASFMLTTAVPQGESDPDWFFLDVRGAPTAGAPTDGAAGMTLTAPWDGHGMTATQSHGIRFMDFPAVRLAAPGMFTTVQARTGGVIGCWFTAVIAGVVHAAIHAARQSLAPRKDALRPYEQVEWARAQTEAWLVEQALEGMLGAVERSASLEDPGARYAVLQGKTAVAELAESVLTRLCRVLGGGTFARHSPFGFWFEDMRALGFLRPPWGLAYDRLIAGGWDGPPPAQ